MISCQSPKTQLLCLGWWDKVLSTLAITVQRKESAWVFRFNFVLLGEIHGTNLLVKVCKAGNKKMLLLTAVLMEDNDKIARKEG